MAEYDLTTRIAHFLDRHLVFPLLEFLSVKEIYNEKELLQGKLNLFSDTTMVDFAMDVYKTFILMMFLMIWEKEEQLLLYSWNSFKKKMNQLWRYLKIWKLQDKCSQPGMVRCCLITWQISMVSGRNI